MIANPPEVTLLPDRVSIEETIEEDECPCGGQGWVSIDRVLGNEHYTEDVPCPEPGCTARD